MKKNTAGKITFYVHDKTNDVPLTGAAATLTPRCSQDGGAFAALADTTPDELG